MSELKTKRNDKSPVEFLNAIEDATKRKDAFFVLEMMERISGCKAEMWGDSIIGFDSYNYQYASGKSGTWMKIGFSPRKAALTLYMMNGHEEMADLLDKLGKFKTGKSCLYIKKLEDVDLVVLEEMIAFSLKNFKPGC